MIGWRMFRLDAESEPWGPSLQAVVGNRCCMYYHLGKLFKVTSITTMEAPMLCLPY